MTTDDLVTRPARWWLPAGLVITPLMISAIVLSQRTWNPVLDLAMTEFRVRDVGTRQTPLIGLPGRIGDFPDQGSHPGPWSFYLIAPVYRLAGATAYGMQLGSILINSVAAVATLWVVQRRGRTAVTVGMAAVLALAIRGYGLEVLTQPWNPYFPLLFWLLVMVSTWSVLEGDRWMFLIVVGAGTVAAQTHVPYLLPCLAMSVMGLVVLGRRWRHGSQGARNALLGGVGLGALLWLAPLVDQLVRDPGNIRRLIEHFTGDTAEEPIGVAEGTTVFFRHLDLPRALVRLLGDDQAFLDISGEPSGILFGGVLMFLLWLGSVVIAVRMRHRSLINLHTVVAVALAVGWFSMIRIFGKVWFYLTLWAWGTALVAALAMVWTVVAWWRTSKSARRWPIAVAVTATAAAITLAASVLSLTATASLEVPEQQISDALGETIAPTVAALEAGEGAAVGKDGTYLVFWQDAAFIGSPGYGLVNELERRGFDVGVHRTWRVPVTPHRALDPGEFDAEVHLVTGDFIEEWRTREGYVEVATVDVRTDEERARFEDLESRVLLRMEELGRSDLIPVVEENLFGALIEPGLPQDVVHQMEEMLLLFKPVSVFIAPPGSSF